MTILEAILEFIGSYQPVTGTVYFWDETNSVLVSATQPLEGMAGVNWPWIAAAALIIVSVYCLFKAIGGLFKW